MSTVSASQGFVLNTSFDGMSQSSSSTMGKAAFVGSIDVSVARQKKSAPYNMAEGRTM